MLCGGVGAARYLSGLVRVVDPSRVAAIVNTGDDCTLHGLSISPDIDTITYTLAGAIDPARGWGLSGETWHAMGALDRFTRVRPQGSVAAPTWFNLGDRDLATHFYRTARLAEGASLTDVTDEIRRAWEVAITILPMTDGECRTMVSTPDHGVIAFQDYFVKHRHAVPVSSVSFEGSPPPTAQVLDALGRASRIVVAPSNPLVSIAPIRSIDAVERLLVQRRADVVAVSPIVGGAALKGPADRMLAELGHDPTVVGVARLYAPIASTLVVDLVDADLVDHVEAEGMRCVVTSTVMSSTAVAESLASVTVGLS